VFHSKFGEALVASNPMVLLGWLTSKTKKSSLKNLPRMVNLQHKKRRRRQARNQKMK